MGSSDKNATMVQLPRMVSLPSILHTDHWQENPETPQRRSSLSRSESNRERGGPSRKRAGPALLEVLRQRAAPQYEVDAIISVSLKKNNRENLFHVNDDAMLLSANVGLRSTVDSASTSPGRIY